VEHDMVFTGKFAAILRQNAREYNPYSLCFFLVLQKICSVKTLRPCTQENFRFFGA